MESNDGDEIDETRGDEDSSSSEEPGTSGSATNRDVVIKTCSACGDAYQGTMTCKDCQQYCHYREEFSVVLRNIVTDQVFLPCQPCDRAVSISRERALASIDQQKQAKNMLSSTAKKFKLAKEGDNVLIPVPDVDRGRAEFPNVAGVVLDVDAEGGHTIGTAQGSLKGKYTRAEIIPSIASFLTPSDVPDNLISLRTAAREES